MTAPLWMEPIGILGALITNVGTADADFESFMASRYGPMLRAARLLVLDQSQAEDLLQSALIRTYTHWSSLATPSAGEAYTHTTMARLALRGRRRKWTSERPTDPIPERPAPDVYRQRDDVDAVRRALASLPIEQRAVLVLRYYVQFSEPETAAALNCALGTVKSRASRALEALRSGGLLEISPQALEATND
jgi:RNA polymerase sigma-70 factor (sigma-E family)